MKRSKANELFKRLSEQNPHPTTELRYQSPFELLIAVILSAQATDKQVNIVTTPLFAAANTPQAFLQLGEPRLKQLIQSIGLFNTKARNIILTCEKLMTSHQSKVPDTLEALEALPGVGRKTANVVLNTAFNLPTIAVDTHVFRVANRTGLACGKTPLAIERQLMTTVPAHYQHKAHHWLILHGRHVCSARKPQCGKCLIQDLCDYPHKVIN